MEKLNFNGQKPFGTLLFRLLMDRRYEILRAIVQQFIETAEPVGSKSIVLGYHLSVSPATVRNEMMWLEEEGLIEQPYTSAGRVPTDLGYRLFVDKMLEDVKERKEALTVFEKVLKSYHLQKAREKLYDAVSILAQATQNASFATLPDNKRTFYVGISNVLKQPEFMHDPMLASQVIEVLEDNNRFVATLRTLPIDEDEIRIFIGRENLLKQIQSCSLIVVKYDFDGNDGFTGLLGPKRMRYSFNRAVLENVKQMLES